MLVSAYCHIEWVGKLDVGSAAAFQLEVFAMALDTDSGFGVASQVQGSFLSVISRSNSIFHQSSIQSHSDQFLPCVALNDYLH